MPTAEPLDVRFWRRVVVAGADDCWVWTGARSKSGYGRIGADRPRRVLQAHRVAYELTNGVHLPPEDCVLHRCDNPPCCNPAHLFLGDRAVNNADMDAKGRA